MASGIGHFNRRELLKSLGAATASPASRMLLCYRFARDCHELPCCTSHVNAPSTRTWGLHSWKEPHHQN